MASRVFLQREGVVARDQQWVEVTRITTFGEATLANLGCWFNPTSGSGVWVNMGYSVAPNTTINFAHALNLTWATMRHLHTTGDSRGHFNESVWSLGLTKNIRSVQLHRRSPSELVLLTDDCVRGGGAVKSGCPPADLSLRAGWAHQEPCVCLKASLLNCNHSWQRGYDQAAVRNFLSSA